jgi:hypothetical protein
MHNLVVLLPTLNRINLLKRFANSYIETKAEAPLLILVDEDDLRLNQVGYDEVAALSDSFRIVSTRINVTMGAKCRYVYKDYLKNHFPEAKYVGLLNDDHFCVTPEWDKIVIARFRSGVEMISTNDGFWNFGIQPVGLTAWSIDMLDRCGIPIYPEGLDHLFIDNIWKAIGESSGIWRETMKVNIEHRHVFKGDMEPDQTFHKSNNQEQYQKDGKVFEDFMNTQFKTVIDKIMNVRAQALVDAKF